MPNETPDTFGYLIMAMLFSFGFIAAFAISVYSRFHSLDKDIETIQRLKDDV